MKKGTKTQQNQQQRTQQPRSDPGGPPPVITSTDVKHRTCKISLPRNTSYHRLHVAEALIEYTNFKDIEAIGTRQSNAEWYVTFYKKEAHAAFLELGVININERNGYISTLDSKTHRLRIHWAPYHLAMSGLHAKLAGALPQGATILSLGYERSQINELQHVATLVRFAVVSFDGPASRLPHLLTVTEGEEQMEVLVTTQGRDPICLKCRRVGHMRAQCDTPYCARGAGTRRKSVKAVLRATPAR